MQNDSKAANMTRKSKLFRLPADVLTRHVPSLESRGLVGARCMLGRPRLKGIKE